jgi:GT2 family glycosyltransferase
VVRPLSKIKIIFAKNLSISPALSIIIVSYNCVDFVREAVRSIQRYVETSYEIIIVDNASTDRIQEIVTPMDKAIKFVSNSTNKGFSAANNQGFTLSAGATILLLNPDAELLDNSLNKALQHLEGDPHAVIGPKILNPDGSLQRSVLRVPDFISVLSEALFVGYLFSGHSQILKLNARKALSGACLMMKRETYSAVGGFDEDLFWMDDVDFTIKARERGYKPLYLESWVIKHSIGESSKKNYNVVISNQLISKLKFFRKHGRWIDYSLGILFTEVQIFTRTIIFLLLSPIKKKYREKLRAYAYAQKSFLRYLFNKTSPLF